MQSNFQSLNVLPDSEVVEDINSSSDDVASQIEKIFMSVLRKENFPKGTVLKVPGQVAKKIYLIKSGLMICTTLNDGKEIGSAFYADGDIGGDLTSFLTNKPSKLTIKLIEPTELYVLNKSDLIELQKKCPTTEHSIHCLLYEHLINKLQLKIDDLHHGSTAERYNMLQLRFPSVVHRLPLGFIASFLEMTPETLSRIRSQK